VICCAVGKQESRHTLVATHRIKLTWLGGRGVHLQPLTLLGGGQEHSDFDKEGSDAQNRVKVVWVWGGKAPPG